MMSHSVSLYLRRWSVPVHWALSLFPLFLMISASQRNSITPALAVFFLLIACGLMPVIFDKHRILSACLGTMVLFGCSLLYPDPAFSLPVIASICLFYLCRSKAMTSADKHIRGAVGTILYAAAQWGVSHSEQDFFHGFSMIRYPLICGFACFFLMFLFMINEEAMQEASSQRVLPKNVVNKNRLIALICFLVTFMFAAIPAIAEFLKGLAETLRSILRTIIQFVLSLLPDTQVMQGAPQGMGDHDFSSAPSAGEPSAFAVWMERILLVFSAVLACIALYFLLKFLFKRCRQLLIRIRTWFHEYLKSSSEDYTDEIFDTRETQENYVQRRRSRRLKREQLHRGSPRDRIRYSYSLWLDRHAKNNLSATARENLVYDAAVIYEKARYSEEEITTQDADSFRQML